VFGEHLANGTGVTGKSGNGFGVAGLSGLSNGVFGQSDFGIGVVGQSQFGIAVVGIGGFPEVVPSPDIFVGRSLEQGDVFRVRSTGDVQVRGVTLNCDKNVKANFSNVNTRQILERLSCMPIAEWNYKADPTSVHHIGPTSQDFKLAFGLNGDEDERISVVDAQGIALAAIQGLNEKLNTENAQLRANVVSLETRLAAIESNLRAAGITAGIMETVHLPPLA